MAQSTPLFVGLDVHKDSIAVAHAAGGSAEPPVFVGAIGPRQADLDQLLCRLHLADQTVRNALSGDALDCTKGDRGNGTARHAARPGCIPVCVSTRGGTV